MTRTDTIVIGAGQAGLATSACLTELDHDHVVLERGAVAERWRSERWDSLRLLTPELDDPPARVDLPRPGTRRVHDRTRVRRPPDAVRGVFTAPVVGDSPVRSVERAPGGFRVVDRTRRVAGRQRRDRHRVRRPAGGPGVRGRAGRRRRSRSRPTGTGTPSSSPTAACSWSARRPPASSSRPSCAGPDARSTSRSGATPGCRAVTVGPTSGGGSTGSGSSTTRVEGRDRARIRSEPSAQLSRRERRRDDRPRLAGVARRDDERPARRGRRVARVLRRRSRRHGRREPTRIFERLLDRIDRGIDAEGVLAPTASGSRRHR